MFRLLTAFCFLFVLGCTLNQNRGLASKKKHDHHYKKSHDKEHYPHSHKHKKNCGHKMEKVGKNVVYLHDGHKHKAHGEHYDDL